MKISTKAALLSAFVFPGAGHIYLKQYMVGTLLAGASFASIYYLISKAIERAFEISEKIQSGDTQLDIEAITQLVSQQPGGTDAHLLNIATTTFIICWLVGIIHSYKVGSVRGNTDEVLGNK